MTNIKCSHCGLVSARTNERCKGCGAAFTTTIAVTPTRAMPKRIMVLVIGCAAVIVAVLLAVRLTSSKTTTPPPNEVKQLLLANEAVNLPITATLLTELTEELWSGELTDDFLLRDHHEALALKRLGLANVEFTVVQVAPDCYRFDVYEVPRESRLAAKGSDWVMDRNPNGKFERCDDRWKYHTTITLRDPETVDQESMAARVPSLSDVGLTRPEYNQKSSRSQTTITIGSIEILEVSDVVTTPEGTYTVGFKCRFKPNSLGVVFDVSSPIFKSMPLPVRNLFMNSLMVTFDKRLHYLNAAQFILNKNTGTFSEGGIALGHAELVKGGSVMAQWKITNVFFDQKDQTNYTFHPVD